MSLSLSNGTTTITLPGNLLWEDELAWDPCSQVVEQTLSGAVLVEEFTRAAGQPISYRGGLPWVQLTRTALLALQALGAPAGVVLTLTHHDGRTFRVTPRRDGDGWLKALPWPVVGDSGAANPSAGAAYSIELLRLLEIPA